MTPRKDGVPLTLDGQIARTPDPGRGRQGVQWKTQLSSAESAAVSRAMFAAGCTSRAEWVRRLILLGT